ncbi:hypothetical protein [Maricaulis salignorans]|uniref:Polymer-forming protein n=1 Tax=Maricaulis salignorans TaxID=144026 RepID=A0A1G9NYI8_9PROT|nr:hypothetical protein [Maricaulis salignorans]SDL91450.1 hypothetical protein SAMN04488568_10335 [Maricaulis salignorans]
MRKALAMSAALAAAMATAGCVIVVDDGHSGGEAKRLHSERTQDGYVVLDRDGDYSRIGGNINLRGRLGGDLSLVAGDVDADQLAVDGDVSIAGGDIDYSGHVGGEASIAGGDIDWNADVDGELGLASGSLNVAGEIGGSASIAAASLTSTANFNDGLNANGNRIHLGGSVAGDLRVVSVGEIRRRRDYDDTDGQVELTGVIRNGGDVCARSVIVTSTARINGTLRVWAEAQPEIEAGAQTDDLVFVPRNGRDCKDIDSVFD